MPSRSELAGMSHARAKFHKLLRRLDAVKILVGTVGRHQLEVLKLIVKRVAILVMNDLTIWNWSVIRLPDLPVEGFDAPNDVLPTRPVVRPLRPVPGFRIAAELDAVEDNRFDLCHAVASLTICVIVLHLSP